MNLNPRITCKDGVSLSVQANEYAYCEPRLTLSERWEEYSRVEVGFVRGVKSMPESWLDYSDDGTLNSDVYGYVPVALVKEFIESHGGMM
jgi:hypothetical protein